MAQQIRSESGTLYFHLPEILVRGSSLTQTHPIAPPGFPAAPPAILTLENFTMRIPTSIGYALALAAALTLTSGCTPSGVGSGAGYASRAAQSGVGGGPVGGPCKNCSGVGGGPVGAPNNGSGVGGGPVGSGCKTCMTIPEVDWNFSKVPRYAKDVNEPHPIRHHRKGEGDVQGGGPGGPCKNCNLQVPGR